MVHINLWTDGLTSTKMDCVSLRLHVLPKYLHLTLCLVVKHYINKVFISIITILLTSFVIIDDEQIKTCNVSFYFLVWSMSHPLPWRRWRLWPILQPATRGWSKLTWLTFVTMQIKGKNIKSIQVVKSELLPRLDVNVTHRCFCLTLVYCSTKTHNDQ